MSNICCCHALSAGATVAILQLIIVSMQMAGSGIVLHRYETWEDNEPSQWERRPTPSPSTVDPTNTASTTLGKVIPTHWVESWLEFQLAEHIGFCAVWIVSICLVGLAFRYYMPVLVLPNIFVLGIAFIITLVVAVSIIFRLIDVDSDYRTDDYEEAFLIFVCAALLLWLFAIAGFLVVMVMFYKYIVKVDARDNRPMTGQTNNDRDY